MSLPTKTDFRPEAGSPPAARSCSSVSASKSKSKVMAKHSHTERPAIHRLKRSMCAISALHRLKGKRRDGLLDKTMVSTQEAQDENQPPARKAIWDSEMELLQIKAEDLDKIRAPEPPKEDKPVVTSTVSVRKIKPASELDKPKLKSVLVAKPASAGAELKPVNYTAHAGPRYDAEGRVIHYSILGSFEDYRREAIKHGDLLDVPTPQAETLTENQLTVKYEKKRKRVEQRVRSDESNALQNWQNKMMERKRQQGYISKLLQKAPEDLTMNLGDSYRKRCEDYYLIDRAIPYKDNGKGYRVGSEFWKQQEHFGDELSGLHMTLTQTEKGYPPPVEQFGLSNITREEKGMQWDPEYHNPSHLPWNQTSYLLQRQKQLKSIIKELRPHKSDFAELQVIGTNKPHIKQVEEDMKSEAKGDDSETPRDTEGDQPQGKEEDPFHEYPDVRAPPIFGPSLQFAGQAARWTGDSNSLTGQVGIEARVAFEARTGIRVTSYLDMINDGTTSIYFDWKKVPKNNPFDIIKPEVQRFYFNSGSGVVLPGETLRFPFVFKSRCAGVFTEQWMLETRPVLCGGSALLLTLRGVAVQEDRFLKQRKELEQALEAKQSQQMVSLLVDDLLEGVRTPERSRSPVDAHITEEEIFCRFNPGLVYHHSTVTDMKQLHKDLYPEEEQSGVVWNLCVLDLRDTVIEMEKEEEKQETLLAGLNSVAASLTYRTHLPVQDLFHNVCHNLLSEAVDSIAGQSFIIRHKMGMTVPETADIDDSGTAKETQQVDNNKVKVDNVKDKKSGAKAGKSKESIKSKTSTTSMVKKGAEPARPPGVEAAVEVRPSSPVVQQQDQGLQRKYRQKLYTQAYLILGDMLQNMDLLFQHLLTTSTPSPS